MELSRHPLERFSVAFSLETGRLPAMKPYSNDLRSRIVATYERGEYSLEEVAALFAMSVASVKNFVRRYRETGSAEGLPHAGGQTLSLNDQQVGFVRDAIKETTDLTLAELRQRLKRKYQKGVSAPTLSRLLQRLGLPRKKSRSTPANEIRTESDRHGRHINTP
jgi:transposase